MPCSDCRSLANGRAPGGRWARAGGMSLIEVLVAVVVVGIGALSAISMQLLSKRNNFEAGQRLLATHLANTLAERMRADNSPDLLAAYVQLAAQTADQAVGDGRVAEYLTILCTPEMCCPDGVCCLKEIDQCTPQQVAKVVLFQWEAMLDGAMELNPDSSSAGGLNRPTACISSEGAAGSAGFYSITIAFRGTLAMPDNPDVDCGRDAIRGGVSLYDEGNGYSYRRTLTVPAYIKPTVLK